MDAVGPQSNVLRCRAELPQALLAGTQRLFCDLATRNVPDQSGKDCLSSFRISDRIGSLFEPRDLTVAWPDDAELALPAASLVPLVTNYQRVDAGLAFWPVATENDVAQLGKAIDSARRQDPRRAGVRVELERVESALEEPVLWRRNRGMAITVRRIDVGGAVERPVGHVRSYGGDSLSECTRAA